MRKKILLFSALLVLSALLVITSIFLCNKVFYCKSIQSLTGLEATYYDKIMLFNGSQRAEITDPAKIESVLSHFYDTKLRVRSPRDLNMGSYFSVSLYKGGERIVSVVNKNVYILNGEESVLNVTQYELKTHVPQDVAKRIYEECGIQTGGTQLE